jgi:poly-beta-1,6-N-acetyl-D-glucosamine N-deacetylase
VTAPAVLRVPRRVAAGLLGLVAFAIPIYVFIDAQAARPPVRLTAPVVAAGDVPRVAVPPYRDAVPVLVYHDISDRPGRFTVSALNFTIQMAALRSAGFHTISAAQLLAFLAGTGVLPVRPVLITFDDGLGSEWRVADPILARYGFRAMAFVISGQLGQHGYYYLHPAELRALIASGRWDIEAHTHLAHVYAPIDAQGDYGPALLSREWLPRQHRLETEAEYETRIRLDLTVNAAELRAYGADPRIFAFPFSPARTPTNDVRLVPMLRALVGQRFRVSFVDADGRRFLTRYDASDTQQLPRIEVDRTTTATGLLERLSSLAPLAPTVNGFSSRQRWLYEGAQRAGARSPLAGARSPRASARSPLAGARSPRAGARSPLAGARLTLRAPTRAWLAAYLWPSRSDLWQTYQVTVTVGGLGGKTSGTSETLIVGNNADGFDRYAVTLSAARLSASRLPEHGRSQLLQRVAVASASSHRLTVKLAGGHVTVLIDGRTTLTLAVPRSIHGGIGFGTWRAAAGSPVAWLADLSVTPAGR